MSLSRMDLDGPGAGSPAGLVTKILKAQPVIRLPVPIEELALELDIEDIRELSTDGFEGGLITDVVRSSGFILVNRNARRGRRRFTIGHELGHFLLTSHVVPAGGFQCSRADMRQWANREKSAAIRMEVEANEFASLMLMPPPLWRKELGALGDPDLAQIVTLANLFDVSKEAAARAYAQYHDDPVAILVVKDGRVDKTYRNVQRFPKLCIQANDQVPSHSLFFRAPKQLHTPSTIGQTDAGAWLESDWGKRLPTLYEQVFFQRDGFALIMLHTEESEDDEYDPEEHQSSKQRLQQRLSRRL